MGLSNSQYESIMRSYQQRQLLEKGNFKKVRWVVPGGSSGGRRCRS